LASYVYLLYTQVAVLYSEWSRGDYTLLIAFLVKEVFFVTYVVIWLFLRVLLPIAALPFILLVKLATLSSSEYQKQKVSPSRLRSTKLCA
jgi:hypothetical protein